MTKHNQVKMCILLFVDNFSLLAKEISMEIWFSPLLPIYVE